MGKKEAVLRQAQHDLFFTQNPELITLNIELPRLLTQSGRKLKII